jgi:hypothetical protein
MLLKCFARGFALQARFVCHSFQRILMRLLAERG